MNECINVSSKSTTREYLNFSELIFGKNGILLSRVQSLTLFSVTVF